MTDDQIDMFGGAYPDSPGYQRTDTSRAAARAVKPKAAWVRARVMDALARFGPMTTVQIAAKVGLPYETVQPRTSESRAKGEIIDTGRRGPSRDPAKAAIVWAVAPTTVSDASPCNGEA